MDIVRDLLTGGQCPPPIEIHYNGDLAADSTTKRYAGSLVKIVDINDVDHGIFYTFGGLSTALENIAGILAEEQGTSGNYLPDDDDYGMQVRKMYPLFPSSVIRAEYGQTDAAGTDSTDTGASGSAGSTTFTAGSGGTADYLIGGWIYMVDGSNAGYLHYVKNDDGSGAITLTTALVNAVSSGDKFLFINPAPARGVDFNATYTGLKSEIDSDNWHMTIQGIMTYIKAPGVALQRLDRDKHDGLKIDNARFYHDFVFTGVGDVADGGPNLVWTRNLAAA